MVNVVNDKVVIASQDISQAVLNFDNSSISSSRASLPLVSENPGKLSIAPSEAICIPTPCKNVSPRVDVHLGVYESPDNGNFYMDELLECEIFDVNRESVSHFCGHMTFNS